MIYKKGNLLDVNTGIIVHGCNAQGVMGAGVAKLLKEKYPDCFKNYVQDLDFGHGLGNVSWCWLYCGDSHERNVCIASCITQEFYGRDPDTRYVSYDAIDDCFYTVFAEASECGWDVHMPKIGAGLGGGDWKIIETIIETAAAKHGVGSNKIFIWEL